MSINHLLPLRTLTQIRFNFYNQTRMCFFHHLFRNHLLVARFPTCQSILDKKDVQYIPKHKLNSINQSRFRHLDSSSADDLASSSSNSNTKKDRQKDQFIHDHLNSSQDQIGSFDETFPFEQDIVKEPPRERFGVIKAIVIIVSGIYFGAYVAMVGAKLLEELDIFVRESDDDED